MEKKRFKNLKTLREVAFKNNVSYDMIIRHVKRMRKELMDKGIIKEKRMGTRVFYEVNDEKKLFEELFRRGISVEGYNAPEWLINLEKQIREENKRV